MARLGLVFLITILVGTAAFIVRGETARGASAIGERAALTTYVAQIEPLRLAVNRLLEEADPILGAYREHRIPARVAAGRFSRLEQRFAGYTIQIAAIRPTTPELTRLQRVYLHTYFYEDAYLSALAAALPARDFESLPHTANLQRAMIIGWRTGLHVLAQRLGVRLPADLAVAGRGEIAPSPEGS